jgi:hypothetical protein
MGSDLAPETCFLYLLNYFEYIIWWETSTELLSIVLLYHPENLTQIHYFSLTFMPEFRVRRDTLIPVFGSTPWSHMEWVEV